MLRAQLDTIGTALMKVYRKKVHLKREKWNKLRDKQEQTIHGQLFLLFGDHKWLLRLRQIMFSSNIEQTWLQVTSFPSFRSFLWTKRVCSRPRIIAEQLQRDFWTVFCPTFCSMTTHSSFKWPTNVTKDEFKKRNGQETSSVSRQDSSWRGQLDKIWTSGESFEFFR